MSFAQSLSPLGSAELKKILYFLLISSIRPKYTIIYNNQEINRKKAAHEIWVIKVCIRANLSEHTISYYTKFWVFVLAFAKLITYNTV